MRKPNKKEYINSDNAKKECLLLECKEKYNENYDAEIESLEKKLDSLETSLATYNKKVVDIIDISKEENFITSSRFAFELKNIFIDNNLFECEDNTKKQYEKLNDFFNNCIKISSKLSKYYQEQFKKK